MSWLNAFYIREALQSVVVCTVQPTQQVKNSLPKFPEMPFKEDAKQEISEEQKELENARAIAYLKSLKTKTKNQAKGDYLIMAEDVIINNMIKI